MPRVVAFARAHRADDGHVMHVASKPRQVLADADAGDGGLNVLERPAIGVAGFQIERVHLTGAAVHPQQDDGLATLGIAGGLLSEGFEPAGHRTADGTGGRQLEHIPTTQFRTLATGEGCARHGFVPCLE